MRTGIHRLLASHTAFFVGIAGLAAIISGVIGALVWLADLLDRGDGDKLRWGFWHNPFMQFPPFNEPFLDASMYILFVCSAAACLGGLLLVLDVRRGVTLVVWQARVSIVINSVIALFIVAMMFMFAEDQRGEWHLGGTALALMLRLGSIAVDLILLVLLSSQIVRDFFLSQAHSATYSFDVITQTDNGRIRQSHPRFNTEFTAK